MANPNLKIRIGAVDRTGNAFRSINTGLSRVKNAVFSVQTAVATLAGATGFGLLVKGTIETNREFQSLEASLSTFLGSTEKAEKAFGILQQFAATTPFALREVVGGFNKLIARGLNPSISALTAFGNIASGTGKTLDQFVEAAADAAVGEFERLKEFGIKARSEGDKVVFTFKGVETEVIKSGAAISDFLVTLGETEFAGAIEKQSQTLNGAFSNLGDSFDIFKRSIGEAGFNDALVNLARNFSEIAKQNDGLAQSIGRFLAGGVNAIPTIFGAVSDAADIVRRNLDFLRKSFIAVTAFVFTRAILGQAVAFLRLAGALLTARKAATIYSATSKVLTLSTLATAIVFAKLTGQLDKMVEGIESAVKQATDLLEKTFPGLRGELEKLFPSLNKDIKALEELKNANDLTITSTEELDRQLAELVGTMDDGPKKAGAFAEAMKKLAADARNMESQFANFATRGLQSLEDNLVSVAMQTKSTKEAFKDMARSIIADLIRIEIRRSITAPLAEMIPGFFGKADGAKAMGGPVTAGRPYLVGERGPELFVPGRTGGIVPNNAMGGGGVTINQTVQITTGVQQTVRAEVMNMLPDIANATKGAVLDARRRGGSFAAAFG